MNRYQIYPLATSYINGDASYAIGHMYARWAARNKIKFLFNSHPTELNKFILDIDADLSSEEAIHSYVWMPKYEECKGRRYTTFVVFQREGGDRPLERGVRFVTAPPDYAQIYNNSKTIHFIGKNVPKILDGKIPWLPR